MENSNAMQNIERALDAIQRAIIGRRSGCAFRVYITSGATITYSTSTFTKYDYATKGTEEYDIGGNYDMSSSKFVAPYDGVYIFAHAIQAYANFTRGISALYKNGTIVSRGAEGSASDGAGGVDILFLSQGDYVEHYFWCNTASLQWNEAPQTYFAGAALYQIGVSTPGTA